MLNSSTHNHVFKHSIRHKMTPIFCMIAIGWYLLENWSHLINEQYFKLGLSVFGVASLLAIATVFKYKIVINERKNVLITIPFTVSPWDKLLSWAELNFKNI
jgi:hypothetical protein